MSFLDIVSKFNQQADSHSKSQSLNPFSEQFEQSRSPSPRFSREEYGKPVAGSKTDLRGRKAKTHICREILELCTVIHDVGTYNAKKRDPDDDDDDDEADDGTIIVSFGELFQIYTKISDKVVGLLIAAKRRGFVYFDREILFQRRDDDVLIALLKPISEINKILKEDISQANAPAPVEPKPAEKKKSASSSKTKRAKPECNKEQTPTIDNCTTPVDQTNVILEVNGDAVVVGVENGGENDGRETMSNGVIDAVEELLVIDNGENDDDKTNCSEEVVGGDAAVENDGGETKRSEEEVIGGDAAVEVVGGDAAGEIENHSGENGEGVIKCDVDEAVVAVEEVNNSGEFSESIGEESIRDTSVDVGEDAIGEGAIGEGTIGEGTIGEGTIGEGAIGEGVIGEGAIGEGAIGEVIKTIDVNDSNEVVEEKNANTDSADGKETEEIIIENVQNEKPVNNGKVNVTNESILGMSNGIENINGETEHISLSVN